MDREDKKITIPFRPIYIVVFFLFAFLCYQAHQWVRHFTGAALCGGFGTLTFTVATTRQPCVSDTLEALSGPILTYGLAWAGMALLRSPRHRLFAYTLIFASFAHPRFIQTLTGRGDELILAQQWFGITSRPLVALFVLLIGLPPVIAAFRVIANRRRWLVFISSWLLPLPLLFVMLFGDNFLFGDSHLPAPGSTLLGIALVVLITDLTALALMIVLGPRFLKPGVTDHTPVG